MLDSVTESCIEQRTAAALAIAIFGFNFSKSSRIYPVMF